LCIINICPMKLLVRKEKRLNESYGFSLSVFARIAGYL
jgi:hypothetical protein